MDKITRSLIDTFSESNEITTLEESTRFEHFANFSIASLHVRSGFSLDDIHTSGGSDCGIDGMCIMANGRHVLEPEELDNSIESTKHLDADIVFIQAKTSSSFKGSDIGTFIHGVKDFLSDEPKLIQNDRIKTMKETWDFLISKSSYMVTRRPRCWLYYICTGIWKDDPNLCAVIHSGKEELEKTGLFESVEIKPLGATEIGRLYQKTKNKLETTVNFEKRVALPDIDGVSEAYLGIISFEEYLKLIQDDVGNTYSIFDENVRDFQGINPVNGRIKTTLEDGKFDLFCVLNNGVTIVASSLTPAANRFTLRDYQVVNGCQTSHVLHECRQIKGIKNVSVPIKIVVTEREDIKTSITLATNSQTAVKTEELEALSAFQKKLELYYRAEKNAVSLYYERRSQQYNSDDTIKRTQIITISDQIKSFAAMFLNSPHLASRYYGTIAKRFDGKIFDSDHSLAPYYVSALCYYRAEQYFRSGELDKGLKKARYHLMLLVRILSMGERVEPFNSKQLERNCEQFKLELLDDNRSSDLFHLASKIVINYPESDDDRNLYKTESHTSALIHACTNRPVAHSDLATTAERQMLLPSSEI